MRRLPVLLAALPALALAAGGLFHPEVLTPDSADRWFGAHLVLLPLFPLVAVSMWWLLRGVPGPLAVGARVLSFAYAVLYTALDAISGIGLSWAVDKAAERGEPGPNLGDFFFIGDRIGHPGAICLALAGVLAAMALLPRLGVLAGVGGALVAAGGLLIWKYHVFPYEGVLGAVLVAAGLAAFAWRPQDTTSPARTSGSDSGAASTTVSTSVSGP